MIQQHITPERRIFFAGECIRFQLTGIPVKLQGKAVVRTNIGGAAIKRQEQIEKKEFDRIPRGGDWHDAAMTFTGTNWELTLPLPEPGVFEAKCCFIPDNGDPVLWASGENLQIKVHTADSIAANGIYCAFVRQFGKWKSLQHSPALPETLTELDRAGYTVIPPTGTFRDLIGELDHIFGELNCRILQLLPIHPVPKMYGRMGRFGSPFAATDYFSVDPALAEFDTAATPMEQFCELIDAVHARHGRIFMDIPVNHTGWASKLQCEHPEFFKRSSDGKFASPGAWGIVWADLCQLDYSVCGVTELMAKVFLFWCRNGVDGFRCDAGYMVPEDAWQYIVAKVRNEFPDTVFLLEGLGGPPDVQEKLLGKTGLDWGYSELFQNYSRDEISSYFPYLEHLNNHCGIMANFAETHDNSRLAANGKVYARLRFMVNALLCRNGAFGFANGAEYFATEKIDVHGCGGLNYHAGENLCGLISKLNRLFASHPAFGAGVQIKLIQHGGFNVIAARRFGTNIPELLLLFNLDCQKPAAVSFEATRYSRGTDLLSGRKIALISVSEQLQNVPLAPGEALCISFDDFVIPDAMPDYPAAVLHNRAQAMAQQAALHCADISAAVNADGQKMLISPEKFVSEICGNNAPPPVTTWQFPMDLRREVMLPPGDLLCIRSHGNFTVKITAGKTVIASCSSLPRQNGKEHFVLLALPDNPDAVPRKLTLQIADFCGSRPERHSGTLLQLAPPEKRMVRLAGRYHDAANHYVFGSNNRGGYALFSAQWGKITSKYDAMLAANWHPEYPVDRHIMFTSCRAWIVIDEYSQELTSATLASYSAHPGNRAQWQFILPDGHGGDMQVAVEFRMALDQDAVELRFRRDYSENSSPNPVKLILRPDIEDRINHNTVRACDGAEHLYRNAIIPEKDGFTFAPGGRKLHMHLSGGKFDRAPEWHYMTDLPQERYYGMGDKNDLFSPGYFTAALPAGSEAVLSVFAGDKIVPCHYPAINFPAEVSPASLANDALSRFIVKRDGLNTVIAGYPWFLDWGRDTLIVLRGLLKYPAFHAKCADIIRRFAAFEKDGTIPNMICGGNDSNRDTSDAPLYLIVAARDYIAESKDQNFLNSRCGNRTLREILMSIVDNYRRGTPNGIKMDPASGLIFSPSHFSWMDTNYPAGTPREGYPVEIQALWHAALKFLGENKSAELVRQSIDNFYFTNSVVSDCLHCHSGTPAAQAIPDDHCRSNMLTLITMRAVTDPDKCSRILAEAGKLLIPGAIRTLADAEVSYQLPVKLNGQLLNDPAHPYQGHYCGPEDTSRKMAYHNGTAWCWPFPSYCEALYILGGAHSRKRALALLYSCVDHLENGVIGEIAEVIDGDMPHRGGGCLAQAWSISEFYRVLNILGEK
ncbi:MAG: glycogen debranching enzyme N-terminal domain-containing protein [Lentisphaeria bacterium]|nr:glycogen debranching enzyme N-terminal domain-containing protein [Lentisphaeria bacterium]